MKRMNKFNFLLAASIMALISCEQVTVPEPEVPESMGTTEKVKQDFVIENPSSIGLPSLNENEAISVFSLFSPEENCSFIYSNNSFSGEASQGGTLIALYPYSEDATMTVEGGQIVLNTTVPDVQSFIEKNEQNGNSGALSRADVNALSDIAIGVNSGEGFNFKSIYGKLVLPIRSERDAVTVNSIKLEGLGGEKISGDVEVSVSEKSAHKVISASNTSVVYNGNITVPENENIYVVFNAIPQNFSQGLKLTLTKSDNISLEKVYGEAVTVNVNKESTLDEFVFAAPSKEYYIEYTADQKVDIDGYDCEEYDQETKTGRIYFESANIPDKLFGYEGSSTPDPNLNDIITSIKISAKIKTIGEYAFRLLKQLTSVSFEEGSQLTSIKQFAFQGCSNCVFNFENVTNLEHIGVCAFGDCSKITSYEIFPSSIKTIEDAAFRNLQWTEVIIKEGVEYLGTPDLKNGVFQGCKKITKLDLPSTLKQIEGYGLKIDRDSPNPISIVVICRAITPPTKVTGGTFLISTNKKLVTLYVPDGSLDEYKNPNTTGWTIYSAQMKKLSELQEY